MLGWKATIWWRKLVNNKRILGFLKIPMFVMTFQIASMRNNVKKNFHFNTPSIFLFCYFSSRRLLPPSPGKALKSVPSSSSSSSSSVPPSSSSSSSSNRERRRKKINSETDELDSVNVKEFQDNESPIEDNTKSPSVDGLVRPEEEPKSPQPIAAFPSSVPPEEIFESPRSSASSSSTESSLNDSSSTLANSQNHTQDTVVANTIVEVSKSFLHFFFLIYFFKQARMPFFGAVQFLTCLFFSQKW